MYNLRVGVRMNKRFADYVPWKCYQIPLSSKCVKKKLGLNQVIPQSAKEKQLLKLECDQFCKNLNFCIKRQLRKSKSAGNPRIGKMRRIIVDIPLSASAYNELFAKKLRLPMQLNKRLKIKIRDLKVLLGDQSHILGLKRCSTQVRLTGIISVMFREKEISNFKNDTCERCQTGNLDVQCLHEEEKISGGTWMRMSYQYLRENFSVQRRLRQ